MPFKSVKQKKFMFAKHPKIAKKWADKYGVEPTKKKGSTKWHEKVASK